MKFSKLMLLCLLLLTLNGKLYISLRFSILIFAAFSTSSKLTEYTTEDDINEEENVILTNPVFTTKPLTTLVDEGTNIKLPCFVEKLEGFVLLWKKNSEIITVGEQIIGKVMLVYLY